MPFLLAEISFDHPLRLLALGAVPIIVGLSFWSLWQTARWRMIAVVTLRALAVALLAVAWAAPVDREQISNNWIAHIVDLSPSMGEAGLEAAGQFADREKRDSEVRETWYGVGRGRLREAASLPALRSQTIDDGFLPGGHSTLADAIQRAVGHARDDGAGQIVMFTDGQQATPPDAEEHLVTAAGISTETPIYIVPTAEPSDRIAIRRLAQSTWEADVGEPVTVTAELFGRDANDTQVTFRQDGNVIPPEEEGNPLSRTVRLSSRKPIRVTAQVDGDDGVAANNRRSVVILPAPKKHVLLVAEQGRGSESLAKLLREREFQVTIRKPADFPPETLVSSYDVVLLLNLAPRELTRGAVERLTNFVEAGGGLVTLGGEATFAREALHETPLEELLPLVAANRPQQQRQTRLAVALVIDNSRSMLEESRMGLAKQAAKLAIEPLGENDLIGVIAFGDQSNWISRLTPAKEKNELRGRIDELEATGTRTIMYPAIRKAQLALAAADVDRRQMIIVTDGVSAPGDFEAIARQMAEQDITVSTVSVSAGADQTIVRRIAELAAGRHHHAEDAEDVPRILLAETKTAAEEAAAQEINAMLIEPLGAAPLEELPPLAGLAQTDLREGSSLYLMSPDGDPLLSLRTIGEGKSLAMPVDLTGEAAEAWRKWPQYGELLAELIRSVERSRRPRETDLLITRYGDQLRIRLDAARIPAAWRIAGQAAVRVELTAGEAKTLPMKLIAPAIYEAYLPLTDVAEGDVVQMQTNLRIDPPQSASQSYEAQAAYVVGYDPDLGEGLGEVNESLLTQVAERSGGRVLTTGDTLPEIEASARIESHPLWQWFAMASLVVFFGEIVVRRVGV